MTLAGLRAIAPAEAHLRQIVPAALAGRRCGSATLDAHIPAEAPAAGMWLRCGDSAAVAILTLGGVEARLTGDDGPAAADLLDCAEAVVAEVERGLGLDLVPDRVERAIPADWLVVDIAARKQGTLRDRLLLALAPDVELLPATAEFAPELLGHVHVPVRVRLDGPRLAPHDAADLAQGDLLLLGSRLSAELVTPGARAIAGRFDPAACSFVAAPDSHRSD